MAMLVSRDFTTKKLLLVWLDLMVTGLRKISSRWLNIMLFSFRLIVSITNYNLIH